MSSPQWISIVFSVLLLASGGRAGTENNLFERKLELSISGERGVNLDEYAEEYYEMTSSLVKKSDPNFLIHNPSLTRWNNYSREYANGYFSLDHKRTKDPRALTLIAYNYYFLGADYAREAARFFLEAASLGNVDSQCQLGLIFLTGRGGIEIDIEEAIYWLEMAGEGGDGVALNALGSIYENKENKVFCHQKAVHYYQLAADHGDPMGQNNLGRFYNYGYGVEEDAQKAVKYYKLAEAQGLDWASHNLGLCYFDGDGVEQDPDKGLFYLRKAGEAGYAKSFLVLGDKFRRGLGGEGGAVSKALFYYKKAAEGKIPQANSALGYMYYTGQGTRADHGMAFSLWLQASQEGDTYAQVNLADMYLSGEAVEINPAKALYWLKRAAGAGSEEARKRISDLGFENHHSN